MEKGELIMTVSGPTATFLRALGGLALLVVGGSSTARGQDEQGKLTPEEVDRERQQNLLTPEQRTEPPLRGCCPVAYFLQRKPVRGDPKYKSSYGGHLYHLSSAKAKKTFDEDPEMFLPQFDGLCTMALGGPYGNRVLGHPEVFEIRMARLYLFSSERAKRHFLTVAEATLESAQRLFAQPLSDGYCPVSYQTEGKAIEGNQEFTAPWQGYTYRLASAKAKKAFMENPARYAPRYRGYCATGISENIRRDGNPKLFRVVKDRTYLFASKAAQRTFDADAVETIKKADANWAELLIADHQQPWAGLAVRASPHVPIRAPSRTPSFPPAFLCPAPITQRARSSVG